MSVKQFWRLLKATFREWNEDKASRLAAALAYYTVFSIAPVLVIAIAIAGAIFGEDAARGQIVGQIQGLVGREGAEVIETAIANAGQPDSNEGLIASLINIGLLIFGATGVFAELQGALNTIWEVAPKPDRGVWNFIRQRFLSFSMVLVIGFLLMVSLVVNAALATISGFMSGLLPGVDWVWQLAEFAISLGVITVLFALIFKFLPDVEIRWNDVWIGAALTAVLFTIGRSLLGLYLGQSAFGSTYGAAGSLVVIVAWVFYSAQILFFGAEFTQVYTHRYGSQIRPSENAIPLTPEDRAQQGIPRREYLEEMARKYDQDSYNS
ncbi:MAG: YihY/virulence factor BrkB family protein [Desertifilum sp. SIO1I2]|nr:YihY/virulence factor BrkB family protein [Desertifilum sp. SIO1I2]